MFKGSNKSYLIIKLLSDLFFIELLVLIINVCSNSLNNRFKFFLSNSDLYNKSISWGKLILKNNLDVIKLSNLRLFVK